MNKNNKFLTSWTTILKGKRYFFLWKGSLNSKINYFTIVMLKNTIHCISLFIIYLLLFNFFILYIYILIMHILVMGSKVLNLWVQNTSTIILYIFYIKLEPRKICNCCVLTCFLSICILIYPIVSLHQKAS